MHFAQSQSFFLFSVTTARVFFHTIDKHISVYDLHCTHWRVRQETTYCWAKEIPACRRIKVFLLRMQKVQKNWIHVLQSALQTAGVASHISALGSCPRRRRNYARTWAGENTAWTSSIRGRHGGGCRSLNAWNVRWNRRVYPGSNSKR